MVRNFSPPLDISIHALREEGDCIRRRSRDRLFTFLSTPSARRATVASPTTHTPPRDFYPRPPRGGRLPRDAAALPRSSKFLSTPSARRATFRCCYQRQKGGISIHALREEGDSVQPEWRVPATHFYPRPPRGGRPVRASRPFSVCGISIHALREEGDTLGAIQQGIYNHFYPRPPRGGRRWHPWGVIHLSHISIHALREEGDASRCCCGDVGPYFYPRPPRGGRPCRKSDRLASIQHFYPRPPRGGRPLSSPSRYPHQ